jgi:hypothetical protein
MSNIEPGPGFHGLWPTPCGIYRLSGVSEFNASLVGSLEAIRAEQLAERRQLPQSFFASDDDLLQRVKLKEWGQFIRFVVERIHDTVEQAMPGIGRLKTLILKSPLRACGSNAAMRAPFTMSTRMETVPGPESMWSRSMIRRRAFVIQSMAQRME